MDRSQNEYLYDTDRDHDSKEESEDDGEDDVIEVWEVAAHFSAGSLIPSNII